MKDAFKVCWFEKPYPEPKLKVVAKCDNLEDAKQIAVALRRMRVQEGNINDHFGIIKGDYLRWRSQVVPMLTVSDIQGNRYEQFALLERLVEKLSAFGANSEVIKIIEDTQTELMPPAPSKTSLDPN